MDSFAFVIHARDVADIREHMFFLRPFPDSWVEYFASRVPPFVLSHVRGVRSIATGKEIEGIFVGLPMTPRALLEYSPSFVVDRIRRCGLLAEKKGARIIGLGAFAKRAVAEDGGKAVKDGLHIAVTTGNSYTVATALSALGLACAKMGVDLESETIAIVGGTGSIGKACALILAGQGRKVRIIGRNSEKVERVCREIAAVSSYPVEGFVDVEEGIRNCRAVLTAASAIRDIVDPSWIASKAVVCDVARPRNVAEEVARARRDVLVIEGGVVDVPGEPDFGIDFGYPPGKAYACMAETMILALEGRFEDYTLKEVEAQKVKEIEVLAEKHGFKVSGLRSFGRELTEEEIEAIRRA